MDRVRPWLFIGKYRDTRDRYLLSAYQIEAMLLLAEAVEQPGVRSLYLPVEDKALRGAAPSPCLGVAV